MARIKGSLLARQKSALKRLEAAYEVFKAAGEDKKSCTTTRKGGLRIIHKKGRSYSAECSRMKQEIENLKRNISKNY